MRHRELSAPLDVWPSPADRSMTSAFGAAVVLAAVMAFVAGVEAAIAFVAAAGVATVAFRCRLRAYNEVLRRLAERRGQS